MVIDLGAIKEAAEDHVLGLDMEGGVIYYSVLSRAGIRAMGEATPPDKHPETGEELKLPEHKKIQVIFGNIIATIREHHPSAVCYDSEHLLLQHIMPIIGMVAGVAFLGLKEPELAAGFGMDKKKEIVKDIRTSNPLPGDENLTWGAYGSIAYALYGIKVRSAEARREVAPKLSLPSHLT